MKVISRAVTLLLGALLVGCGGVPQQVPAVPAQPAALAHGLSYVLRGSDRAILVVDAGTGAVISTLPAGRPAPDWRRLYAVRQGQLDAIDPLGGQSVAGRPVPSWATSVEVSANGRWLALTGNGPGDRFQVLESSLSGPAIDVALSGQFTFDGLSGDGRSLFLLEWMSPGHYRIRLYDLAHGQLTNQVISDKREIGQLMSGTAVRSVSTGDGTRQLTLYERSAKGQAFIHTLPVSLAQGDYPFAWCDDLPAPASGWMLVAAPDGHTFYAVNSAAAEVVVIGTGAGNSEPTLSKVRGLAAELDGAQSQAPAAAAVSADGGILYATVGTRLVAIDTARLTVRALTLPGRVITSLATATGGSTVYALDSAGRLLTLDGRTLKPASDVNVGTGALAILRAG